MRPLESLQAEFFAALRMPLRGASRASTELSPDAEPHPETFLRSAESLLKPGANLSSAERLELYHRQYWFRLLDSIAEDFPVLRRMAGETVFWNLIEAYLLHHPSNSFTLRHLGSRLAPFILHHPPLSETSRIWFSSIAQIEYTAMEIYEAGEKQPIVPEQLASVVLELQPHIFLLRLPVPADLCHEWETFSALPAATTLLVLWRDASGGHSRRRCSPLEFELLQRLRRGSTLGTLFDPPLEPEPSPEEIRDLFAHWQSLGWLTSARQAEIVPLLPAPSSESWDGVDKMGSQARPMDGGAPPPNAPPSAPPDAPPTAAPDA